MEVLWHGLLVGCIFTSTVSCRAGEAVQPRANPNPVEYGDEIAAAEDHEHHRIVIVVPKEMPQHVNHVHTYKLAGKGIPLIHSGKVVHDHKHSGKVGHDHGHAGVYGHQHKHVGYLGHQHFGGKPGGGKPAGGGGGGRYQFDPHHPLLRSAAHKLHLQNQYQLQQQPQYLVHGARGRPATSGQLQYVPSSKPHGLGAFMPAEIKQYVEGHYNGAVPVQKQFQQQQFQQQQQQHQQLQHQQQQRFELEPDAPAAAEDVADVDDDDDGGGENQGVPPAPYNLIQLRVPEQHGHNVIKHVDIDLTNNVAKLKTGAKQPVTANYKAVTQYNQVIGHGRAKPTPTPEDEFDGQSEDDEVAGGGGGGGGGKGGGGGGNANGGGEMSMEDVGYRFGEGYRLAVGVGGDSRDFSAGQEQDEEEADDFKEPSDGAEDDEPSDGQAYSSQVYMQR